MEQRMFDVVVNDQLVAVVIEELAKLFIVTLVNELPLGSSVATYLHYEEPVQEVIPQQVIEPKNKKEQTK